MVHRPPFGKPQTKALALVAGLLVAGFVLRFAFINSQSLGHDEIYTLGFLSGYDAYLFAGADLRPVEPFRLAGHYQEALRSNNFLENFTRNIVHEAIRRFTI